ncbi:MAG: parallel beta-helix repeat protein [Pseudohongiellaceae bacterium]|jgi:parallel beta-helix repeat protein
MGDHTVSDTIIRSCGELFAWGGGVILNNCHDTTLAYNSISDAPRYGAYVRDSASTNNLLHHNEIFDVMQNSGDVGGLTIWSAETSNQIVNNVVRDCHTDPDSLVTIGPRGIYVDYLFQDTLVHKNLVYGIHTDDLYNAADFEIKGTNTTMTNNVSVILEEQGVERHVFSRRTPAASTNPQDGVCATITQNIFYNESIVLPPALYHFTGTFFRTDGTCAKTPSYCLSNEEPAPTGTPRILESKDNLLPVGLLSESPFTFGSCQSISLPTWQSINSNQADVDSIIADPQFTTDAQDPNYIYALSPSSPAITQLAFDPLDPVVGVQITQF